MQGAIRSARLDEGKKYVAVPKSALKEFRDQMKPMHTAVKHLKTLARAQSLALLATSPSWAAFQLFASPLMIAVRHPNPAAWANGFSITGAVSTNTFTSALPALDSQAANCFSRPLIRS